MMTRKSVTAATLTGLAMTVLLLMLSGLSSASATASPQWQLFATHNGTEPKVVGGYMSYDPVLNGMLYYTTGSTTAKNQVWELKNSTWHRMFPGNMSLIGSANVMGMVYDGADSQLLFFDWGCRCVWQLSHGNFSQVTTTDSSPPVQRATLAWDPADNYVLMYGGLYVSNGTPSTQTWSYVHGVWTSISTSSSPTARQYTDMAYDSASGKVVLFGGETISVTPKLLNDTWTYSNGTWTNVMPSTAPSGRYFTEPTHMVYYQITGSLIMFGGTGHSHANMNDTWEYSGGHWTKLIEKVSPPATPSLVMSYDSALNGAILVDTHLSKVLTWRLN